MAVSVNNRGKMSLRDNKLFILRELGMESEPITLSELLIKLGGGFKERSVRRWLSLLVHEGVVKKIGEKRSSRYIAVGRLSQSNNAIGSCFSSASLEAIQAIKRPLFERQPMTYSEKWLDSYRPNSDYYLGVALRKQLLESGRRASSQDPAGTYAYQIFNRLMIDLSYNSSRLEGNTYSRLDTERLLLHGDTAIGKLDEEKVMILNHKEAIRYLVNSAPTLQMSSNVIRTLHYLLSDGLVEPLEAGKVRRYGVRISGSTYLPYEDPRKLEQQLEKITAKAIFIQDPFEQSIFLLAHLSYLQAFIDVNKRTARLAANIPLIKDNLVPLAFNDIQVADYMSAIIAIYELQNVQPLVDLYFYSYMRTCADYDSTVKAIGFDEIRVRYRQQRRTLIREAILKELVGGELEVYVIKRAHALVPVEAFKEFIEDVMEDFAQIDESRLAGLGISSDQLATWQHLKALGHKH